MPSWRVVKREQAPGIMLVAVFVCSLALSLGISGALIEVQGKSGWLGVRLLLEGGFGSLVAMEDTLLKSMPIFLCALGVAVTFRMQVWNIGAEGQFAMGAMGATWAVLAFPGAPQILMLPLMFLCAAIGGGVWAFVPAFLRQRFALNEIISTLMLNYIAIFLLQYLVFGPWRDPKGMGFPMTMPFPDAAILPNLFGRVHSGLLVCVLTGALMALFLWRTRLGFELMAGGVNPYAARYARMPYNFLVILVMVLSGALAGFAGSVEVSATLTRLQASIMVGYGYTAIVVAWLARLNILAIAVYALVLAGLRVGVENLQLEMQIPAAFGNILEGLLLITVLAGQFFERYKLRRTGRDA